MTSFLIVRLGALGDIVHAMPVVTALKAARPGARVGWVAPTYDGGSPIRTYTVNWTGGSSGSLACSASPKTKSASRMTSMMRCSCVA